MLTTARSGEAATTPSETQAKVDRKHPIKTRELKTKKLRTPKLKTRNSKKKPFPPPTPASRFRSHPHLNTLQPAKVHITTTGSLASCSPTAKPHNEADR